MRKKASLGAIRGTLVQVKKVFVRAQNLIIRAYLAREYLQCKLPLFNLLVSLHVHIGFSLL